MQDIQHTMNYEIIRYEDKYNDQICELEKELWSSDLNVNKSYLRWKYFHNPYSAPSIVYIVLHEGKVIGVRGMYATKWRLGNDSDTFIALCGGDTVIHPGYRGKGVYIELTNFIRDDLYTLGCSYIFNFSANPGTLITSLAIGWKSIGRIKTISIESYKRMVIRKLFSERMINKLIKTSRVAEPLKRLINVFDYSKLPKYHKNITTNIKIDNRPKPDEMAALVGKLDKGNKLILLRDKKFFKWRYSNPLSKYFFLYWYDNELKGYLVAQTSLYRIDYMEKFNIIELEGVDPVIKFELLKSVISLLGSRSITIWSCMLDENCQRFLAQKGFIEAGSTGAAEYTPTVLVTMTKGLNDKIEYHGTNLLDINNWDLKMIYSDAF